MVEFHLAARARELHGLGRVGLLLCGIEQGEHAPRRGKGRLDLRDHARDLVERLGVLVGVREERLHLAHGEARRHAGDNARTADDRHHRVDDVVDEPRARVGKRAHELRVLAGRVELGVDGVEPGLGFGAVRKRRNQLLVAHVLLNMPAELALDALLRGKALVGHLGDGPRRKDGERRYEHHHHSHGHRDAEHEHERAHDGDHAGKELGEALQQAVAHLIDVVDHAAHEVAVGVRVDERDRHAAELVVGLHAQVAHGLVAQAVDAVALHPLERRRREHHDGELGDEREE